MKKNWMTFIIVFAISFFGINYTFLKEIKAAEVDSLNDVIVQYTSINNVKGDINRDGKLDVNDIVKLFHHNIGSDIIGSTEILEIADYDSNGKININDIIKMTKYLENGGDSSTTAIATDRITFESLENGNAILLQSDNNFMLIDIGKDSGKTMNDSCTPIVQDIKNKLKGNPLKYLLISHFHTDHMACIDTLLNDNEIVIENIIMKDYTNYTDSQSIKNYYSKIINILTQKDINVYQIYDRTYKENLEKIDGHAFSLKNINKTVAACIHEKCEGKYALCTETSYVDCITNTSADRANGEEYTYSKNDTCSNNDICVKTYNEDLSMTVNYKDLNRSRINLKLGNYSLNLFNLPLRNDSENLNSIPVYGTTPVYETTNTGYNFYIANDLTNGGTTVDGTTYDAYGNTDGLLTLEDAHRPGDVKTPSRIADYYAWFVNKYFSKGTVDLYQAGHHGYSNGTTTYLANLLIDQNTKIVFTNAANEQYGSISQWTANSNKLLFSDPTLYKVDKNGNYELNASSITGAKDDMLCKGITAAEAAAKDAAEAKQLNRIYHRCLNDYTISRISHVLYTKGYNKTKIYYLSDFDENPLAFGFNNPNASQITVSKGVEITYNYNKEFNNYALYPGKYEE